MRVESTIVSAFVFSVLMLFAGDAKAGEIIIPDLIPGEVEICRPNPNVEVSVVSGITRALPHWVPYIISRVKTGISDGDLLDITFPGTFPFDSNNANLRYSVDLNFGFSPTLNSDLVDRGISQIQLLQNGSMVNVQYCFIGTSCGTLFRLASTESGQNPVVQLSGAYTIRYVNASNKIIREAAFVLP